MLLKKGAFLCAAAWGFQVALLATTEGARAEKPSSDEVGLADRLANCTSESDEANVLASIGSRGGSKGVREALLDTEYRAVFAGEYSKAERLCRLVSRLAAAANDPQDIARADVSLSAVLRELGDRAETIAALDRALVYYEKHPDDHGIVGAYQGRGIACLSDGDFARALLYLNRALAAAERLKFREGIIPALNSIGEVYREQGLPERALEFYEKARAAVGDDNAWNMAFIFNNIGQAYESMREPAKAAEFIERAMAVAVKNNMRPRVATSLAVLGKLAIEQGATQRAKDFYERSLALSRELRDPTAEGRALLGLADVAYIGGDPAGSIARADEATQLFRKVGQLDSHAAALTAAGKALRAAGKLADAQGRFREAIDDVEALRSSVAGGESEAEAFLEKRLEPYDELVALLVAEEQPAEAFLLAERASGRVLLDVLSRGDAAARDSARTPADRAQARALELRINERNRALLREYSAKDRDETKLAAVAADLQRARHDREDLEARWRTAHPEFNTAAPTAALHSIGDLAPLVRDGQTIAVKFFVTRDRTFAFVIGADLAGAPALKVVTIRISAADLARRTAAFRTALANRSLEWQTPARDLYTLLLGDVMPLAGKSFRLIIGPDGPLWEVAFSALVDENGKTVADRFATSLAPSFAALIQNGKHDETRSARGSTVVFANPDLPPAESALSKAAQDLGLPPSQPLPEMERQATALRDIYDRDALRIFVGKAASEAAARREMPAADVIEFATHGVLNDRSPLYSYLLLSQSEATGDDDGRLEARELMTTRLKARLAILCGCETARGRIGPGEGMIGLSWAFMVAGCPATIVSQWKIDEAAATPLMLAFHKELRAGKSAADALQRAVAGMRKDERYRHPFYWAPFVLVGAAN